MHFLTIFGSIWIGIFSKSKQKLIFFLMNSQKNIFFDNFWLYLNRHFFQKSKKINIFSDGWIVRKIHFFDNFWLYLNRHFFDIFWLYLNRQKLIFFCWIVRKMHFDNFWLYLNRIGSIWIGILQTLNFRANFIFKCILTIFGFIWIGLVLFEFSFYKHWISEPILFFFPKTKKAKIFIIF